MASATGILIQTPTVPQMDGNTNNDGIKNSNCRVNDKKIAFLAIPIDWKKLDVTIWKPTTGKKINTIRKPSTAILVNVSSDVKRQINDRGKICPAKKPTVVTATPQKTVYFNT